jgi:hypothetical protein
MRLCNTYCKMGHYLIKYKQIEEVPEENNDLYGGD